MPTALILSTYGEPTRNSFGEQWMYSYRILERLTRKIAPIPAPVLPIISTVRGFQRVKLWRDHDFLSDLEPLTDRTVAALRGEFERRGVGDEELVVVRSYEFRRPLLRDIVPQLRERGCDRFIIIPMYMGGGDFTNGMTEIAVEDARKAHPWLENEQIDLVPLTEPAEWTDRMADLLGEYVLEEARERGIELPAKDWAVCLAAHGSVQTPPGGVDNGVISFGELCWRVYKRLRPQFGMVRNGWLNHTKGGRWTEPSVENLLPRLRRAGYSKLLYFPWGFTTDNAESALEGRVFCAEMDDPFDRIEHLPCLNDDPRFISYLADRAMEHLKSETTGGAERNLQEATA